MGGGSGQAWPARVMQLVVGSSNACRDRGQRWLKTMLLQAAVLLFHSALFRLRRSSLHRGILCAQIFSADLQLLQLLVVAAAARGAAATARRCGNDVAFMLPAAVGLRWVLPNTKPGAQAA